MEKIEVKHTLIRARSIDEFRSERTKMRIINKPFYRERPGGAFVFDFIREDTNKRMLEAEIEQGLIYVIKN
jgi:hypothetical protein